MEDTNNSAQHSVSIFTVEALVTLIIFVEDVKKPFCFQSLFVLIIMLCDGAV